MELEELNNQLSEMAENHHRGVEQIKAGQILQLNLTLDELRSQFVQIMEENVELRSEISELNLAQSKLLNILLRLEQQLMTGNILIVYTYNCLAMLVGMTVTVTVILFSIAPPNKVGPQSSSTPEPIKKQRKCT